MIFDPFMKPAPFKIQTADQQVYNYLRDCILSGKFRQSERLNQDEIANQLGVSRMPVREAIKRLDNEGLVVSRPHRGAIVTTLGPDAVLELFEMRGALEGLAVSLAIQSMGQESLEEFFGHLEQQLQRLDQAKSNPSLWIQRHEEFHDYICQAANRPHLAASIRKLRQNLAPHIRLYLSAYKHTEMAGFDHRSLLEAMKCGDPVRAEVMMREHVLSAANGVIAFLRRSNAVDKEGL